MKNKPNIEPPKVFCLYHKTINCICIEPCLDDDCVRRRILNQLAIWRQLWKFADAEKQAELMAQAIELKKRLK